MATFPPSKIREEEWDRHKNRIITLYLGTNFEDSEGGEVGEGQVKGKTLDEVAESMRGYGFNASVSQFEAKLNAWGARKNLKPEEWEQIHERLDMLPHATKGRVLISGRVVADSKIRRARRYRKQKSRTACSTRTGSSSGFSALSHYIHIEVQELDGGWARLFDANTSHSPTISHSLGAAAVGEGSAAESPVSSLIHVTPTGLRSPVKNNYCPFDGNGMFDGSTQEYQLEYPTTWFASLPSRRIIATVREYGLDRSSCVGNTAENQSMSTKMIEWNNEIPYSTINNGNLQFPNALLACQSFRTRNQQNRRSMKSAGVYKSKFGHFLLSVIRNGTYELDKIPTEALDGLLGPSGAVNSLLLHCSTNAPNLFTTIASTLLTALVSQRRHDIIAQLIEKHLVHIDNAVVFHGRSRLTLLEAAANEGDEALMELLLSYGGDPNKTYDSRYLSGALGYIMQKLVLTSEPSDRYKDPPSLNILHKLFEAGAEVHRSIIQETLNILDEASASLVIRHIEPSRHEEYFKSELLYKIIRYAEDVHVAGLFSRFVSDCVEQHSGQCMLHHQHVMENTLVMAAQRGRTETFLVMSPHSSHTESDLNERLLSAAIEGRQSMIINSVMLRRPNINPIPHKLYAMGRYSMERYFLEPLILGRHPADRLFIGGTDFYKTSPLAQSIQTKNTELIECFANAGIFNSLHMGGRFEVVIGAAAEVGDMNLVTRLLTSCPNVDSQNMENALYLAIEKGHEDIAHLLLEEGASAYHSGRNYRYADRVQDYEELVLMACRKGSKSIAQRLLSIGDKTVIEKNGAEGHVLFGATQFRKLSSLVDPDITENYLSSFPCNSRHKITAADLIDPRVYFKTTADKFYQDVYDQITITLEGNSNFDLVLESKLATIQLLTAWLTIAISRNNLTLAGNLIKRGANALDATVLTCAIRWGTMGTSQYLLRSMNYHRSAITKGLRTEVLKAAIEQGPSRYDLVRQLIESKLVDILDTGNSEYSDEYGILTPLGVAIRASETESSREFSYSVAKLLLDHGCDPNVIVRFHEDPYPPTNYTAMLEAIEVRSQELVKLLVEYSAEVNPELRHLVRRTPLQKAAEKGDLSMVRLLLQYGAEVNAKPAIAMGGTALQFAAISGNCEVACELLGHGALLYTPPPKIGGRWPIEGAAENGRIDMIQYLWNAKEGTLFPGFDENGFRERNFKKAMRLARDNHHYGCVELIAKLANLSSTATDVPPVVSPIYIDWPPPERTVD
ncbi:ankyrin [Xylaria curta]|nr:ankyrin [Xylaria curta]